MNEADEKGYEETRQDKTEYREENVMNDERVSALLKEYIELQQELNRITEAFSKELEDTVSEYSHEKIEKVLENGAATNKTIKDIQEKMRACLDELERLEKDREI